MDLEAELISLFFVDALMKERCLSKTFDEPGCLTIRKIQLQRDGHEPLRKSFASCRTVNKFPFYLSSLVLGAYVLAVSTRKIK